MFGKLKKLFSGFMPGKGDMTAAILTGVPVATMIEMITKQIGEHADRGAKAHPMYAAYRLLRRIPEPVNDSVSQAFVTVRETEPNGIRDLERNMAALAHNVRDFLILRLYQSPVDYEDRRQKELAQKKTEDVVRDWATLTPTRFATRITALNIEREETERWWNDVSAWYKKQVRALGKGINGMSRDLKSLDDWMKQGEVWLDRQDYSLY